MAIARWSSLRIWLLAATFGGVLVVVGKSILYPAGDKQVTPFEFPTAIPLPEWQHLESTPLDKTEEKDIAAGMDYRFVQKNVVLDIKMRYITSKQADVKKLMKQYGGDRPYPNTLPLRQQEGVGFYSIWGTPERSYLSACINPHGGSTVTEEQFRKNRNIYDLQPIRIWYWLLGRGELRDWRCLWAVLSVPIEPTSSQEDAEKMLLGAWLSWYEWWQPRFPKP